MTQALDPSSAFAIVLDFLTRNHITLEAATTAILRACHAHPDGATPDEITAYAHDALGLDPGSDPDHVILHLATALRHQGRIHPTHGGRFATTWRPEAVVIGVFRIPLHAWPQLQRHALPGHAWITNTHDTA